jgi:predicted Zn-dependent protease
MLVKLAYFGLLVAALGLVFFPSAIVRFLRRLGRSAGDFGRAGKELLTGEEVRGSPLARYEALAGRAVEEKMLAAQPLCADAAVVERVARIGARVAAGATRPGIAYRFRVTEAPEPNAFSVPGGGVLLTRFLVDLTSGDDNQLAGILAHEVAHIDSRHAVRRLAASAAARTGLRILTLGRGALLAQAVGVVEDLLQNGYGREEELEADRRAQLLAARAGFDPRAYPYFLQSLLQRRLETRGYFRTHPSIPERLRALGAAAVPGPV